MKRDFLVISTFMLAVCAVANFWATPEKPFRVHNHQQINADPNLKLISEQSPYMRTER